MKPYMHAKSFFSTTNPAILRKIESHFHLHKICIMIIADISKSYKGMRDGTSDMTELSINIDKSMVSHFVCCNIKL